MRKLNVRLRDGDIREVEAPDDYSLMEALRDGGVDELLALCGGCCSCATCHVIFEQTDFGNMGPVTADEDDLLDSSPHRSETSRLSCQVPVNALPEGIVITIAPED